MLTHPLKYTKPSIKQKSFLQHIKPLNLEEEKQKFLFDQNYNPQFEYENPIKAEELLDYASVSTKYYDLAYQILREVNKEFDNEQNFIKHQSGKKITQKETLSVINQYIQENDLQEHVDVKFSSSYNSRTSLRRNDQHFILQIRLPVNYRSQSIQGMVYHELGTHLFRWLNEFQQPWFQNHNQFGLKTDYQPTEEGIASIHGLLPRNNYYLWAPAILYVASYEATKASFSKLNKILKPYISDPELRWKYCYRVKRGVKDTSTNLAFTKSQTYLEGTLKALKWLVDNKFAVEDLYLGKISSSDIGLAKNLATHTSPILPHFIQDKENYIQVIKEIIKTNKLRKHL